MEKYLTWYILLIKAQLKNIIFWISLMGMLGVALLIEAITLPQNDNTRVLIYNEDGQWADQLVETLENSDSIFQFEKIESEDALKEEVLAGKAECGFIIHAGFRQKLMEGDCRQLVTSVCTAGSASEAVARETFYAVVLETSSDLLLQKVTDEVFEGNEDALKVLIEKNQHYLTSDEVFRLNYQYFNKEAEKHLESSSSVDDRRSQPIRGMVGVMLFLTMLLARGQDLRLGASSIASNLPRYEKIKFLFLKYLAVATPGACLGIGILLCSGESGGVGKELGAMLVFLLVSAFWVLIFGGMFRRENVYSGWIMTLILGNILLCPVFFSLGDYIKAVNILKWIFPLSIYLRLI